MASPFVLGRCSSCACTCRAPVRWPGPRLPVRHGEAIYDNFTMMCPDKTGKIYISPLKFNLTASKGVFTGHWAVVKGTDIPDTVVDVSVATDPATGKEYYRWVIEFQCVEVAGETIFVGVNFYSREKTAAALAEMRAAATRQGLDPYMTSGGSRFGLVIRTRVDCLGIRTVHVWNLLAYGTAHSPEMTHMQALQLSTTRDVATSSTVVVAFSSVAQSLLILTPFV